MSLKANRRTKIVATIGPASDSAEALGQLIEAGVDVFRLNFSHGRVEQHAAVAQRVREQASIHGRHVGILADLQGPKIRISSFCNDSIELATGSHFRLDSQIGEDAGNESGVGFSYLPMLKNLYGGDILLLDDGRIRLRVEEVSDDALDCTVVMGGRLGSRKGINRLGGGIAAPALTDKDLADIEGMRSIMPDYVAVSFVSSSEDIVRAKSLLQDEGVTAAIIAKIERAEVVADEDILNSILLESAGLMVARGDLGVEVGDAELIGIQKDLISRARRADRLVITATQMMESMINSPMPTRAEVFDVANAVLDGTDAVMLSAETAVGSYPNQVVKAMADAALGAERHPVARTSRYRLDRQFTSAQETIAMSAIYAANHFGRVRGIACLTESGTTPLLMSRLSSGLPIFGLSQNPRTLSRLSLCRGVIPLYFDPNVDPAAMSGWLNKQDIKNNDQSRDNATDIGEPFDDSIENRTIAFLLANGYLSSGDALLLTRGATMGSAGSTNMMKILAVP